MWRNNITNISKVVSFCIILFLLYVLVPKVYPILTSYEQEQYNMNFKEKLGSINSTFLPFQTGKNMNVMRDSLRSPSGFLYVAMDGARVRTTVSIDGNDNIAWEANSGDRFAIYGTSDLGGTTWYQILRPGTFDDYYWISSKVVKVIASPGDSHLSDVGIKVVKKLTSNYFEGKKEGYKQQDFSLVSPFIYENTVLYRNEKNNIENEVANGFETKVLDYEFVDGLYINDEYIWVRILEAYRIKNANGETKERFLAREYLLKLDGEEDGERKYYELLNTAELTTE